MDSPNQSNSNCRQPTAFIFMGVAGCGKSTAAADFLSHLASSHSTTSAPLIEADDFHSPENKAKMSAGAPLTDADRWPWLAALGAAIAQSLRPRRPSPHPGRCCGHMLCAQANVPALFDRHHRPDVQGGAHCVCVARCAAARVGSAAACALGALYGCGHACVTVGHVGGADIGLWRWRLRARISSCACGLWIRSRWTADPRNGG
ncbi:hypothetical protein BCR44DRAFT_1082831 [Catenaria anguillulae PL171]|uniref:gluconokinase n=1 Tax=Catenaria anguillulae PL171 TaxID=765915 RepID=A0A1Y2HQN9_9FUNG|nr:hypothetical protein BCR44DRAFT_1082831 [Catenaria anguillulae PL171]